MPSITPPSPSSPVRAASVTSAGGARAFARADARGRVATVDITDGALRVRGEPTFLFGGDVHYFRVRDEAGDPARTHAMWRETLDRMVAAGCNHVTTYVPWDVHEVAAGRFDFSGERDLRAFLALARERRMHVMLKPGPLITGEWPSGFGAFGAVPGWWKQANPGSLERTRTGAPWSFHPVGDPRQRQPALLDPAYLAAVDRWYARFIDEVRPFLGDPVIGLQLDNETNGYWADRFAGPGHAPSSLAHWRQFLAQRYGSVDALNAAWGTKLASFDDAEPPHGALPFRAGRGEETRARDWYDGGKTLIVDYLARLRSMLEAKGVGGLLLTTNDSPFTIRLGPVPLRHAVLLPDGAKNDVAVNVLDLYPSFGGAKGAPLDEPFQVDFFTRLFDARADRATGAQAWMYAAELQGGMYGLGPFRANIPPSATDATLLRAVAAGLKGAALYVLRDGLNADGSRYDYGAALDAEGRPTPRYDVLARWGGFLLRHGDALLRAREVTNRVALVVDGADAAPTADGESRQRLRAVEDPALYGWLAAAGFRVEVVERADLARQAAGTWRMVLAQTPRALPPGALAELERAVGPHGVVCTFLAPPEGAPLPAVERTPTWSLLRAGPIIAELGGFSGALETAWSRHLLDARTVPDAVEVLARERGAGRRAVGYVDRRGPVTRAHLGANVYHRFNTTALYTADKEQLRRAAGLARALLAEAGERPVVETGDPRVLCTSRLAPDRLFLFVENDNAKPQDARLRLSDAVAWGLDPASTYVVRDDLHEVSLGAATGAALLADGIPCRLDALGTAAIVVERSGA